MLDGALNAINDHAGEHNPAVVVNVDEVASLKQLVDARSARKLGSVTRTR